MDFVSSKSIVKENIMRKNVKILKSAKRQKFAKGDTQKPVNVFIQIKESIWK